MFPPNSAGTIELRASPSAGATPMHPERMWNLHGKIRVGGARPHVVFVVDGIEPDSLFQRSSWHRRVMRAGKCANPGRTLPSHVAVNLRRESSPQACRPAPRLPRKRPSQRIVPLAMLSVLGLRSHCRSNPRAGVRRTPWQRHRFKRSRRYFTCHSWSCQWTRSGRARERRRVRRRNASDHGASGIADQRVQWEIVPLKIILHS
jgi:hypothetical protein